MYYILAYVFGRRIESWTVPWHIGKQINVRSTTSVQ